MESIPPPHERSWRHPSELPPPAPENSTSGLRALATVTGLCGLVLVAVVVLAVTPSSSRVTVSGSSPSAVVRANVAGVSSVSSRDTPTSVVIVRVADADAATGGYTAITVWLSDDEPADALMMTEVADVAIVRLIDTDVARTAEYVQFELAGDAPDADDPVVVAMDDPVEVTLGSVASLGAEPGTLVTDEDGELVAVCDEQGAPRSVVVDEAFSGDVVVTGSGASGAED
ncbi:MAG: hypothetical protein M3508_09950 [Actinomycetota bacterium]|nr:hypothetical protein [Actinomycetota bacterium]